MKKRIRPIIQLAALLAAASAGSAAIVAKGAPAPGQAYDCRYFTMTPASGWDASPEKFGMVNVLPKGKISPGLYFKFEGNGSAAGTAEDSIASMIKTYGGSPMTGAMIAGLEFKTTSYVYERTYQTMHVAYRNGTKITITIEGRGAPDNPEIKAMLKSVKLK